MPPVRAVPEGFRTITPHLVVRGADLAIAFYRSAFGAREIYRSSCPRSGRVRNAKLRIGDSMLLVGDEFPEHGCQAPTEGASSPVTIHLYLETIDEIHARAVRLGARSTVAPTNTFWGDRYAQVEDPFGHRWSMATHIEDLSEEEIERRARRAFT